MRRSWATVLMVLVLGAGAAPAHAGGAVLDFDREFYVPGDVVHASSGVWLKSARGRLEDGPYFGFVSKFTGLESMPSPLPHHALKVAPADVRPRPGDDTYGDVSVEFVLPDLDPGKYWLTICNDPCKLQLGDVMPSIMTVASDETEGRFMTTADDLAERIRTLRYEMSNRVFGHRADSIRSRLTALERDTARLEAEVDALKASTRREAAPADDETTSSLPSLLAFVVPAALAGILLGRRSRSA